MEFMASLQGGVDELKPSLFELLSEQQLSSLLPPSLRYLLAVATARHPRYLIRTLNNFDEAYALLSLVLERHFLRTYAGSFTENFYGLKRERVLRVAGGEVRRAQLGSPAEVRETLRLRTADVWKNLLVIVGIPYLKRKLDEGYDIYVPAQATLLGPSFGREQQLPADATLRQRALFYYKLFLRRVYPTLNAAYYFALLSCNLAYLFDGSKFHDPFMWLIGSRVRRLGESDYRAIAAATEAAASKAAGGGPGARPGQGGSIFNPRVLGGIIWPRLMASLRILLPTSIFALKFLEWWHASDFARQLSRKAAEGLELPPPVIAGTGKTGKKPRQQVGKEGAGEGHEQQKSDEHGDAPISTTTHLPIFTVSAPAPGPGSDVCPICLGPIQTATASPYGYVFCYTCIHKWVEGMTDRQTRFMEGAQSEEEGVWGGGEDEQQQEQGGDGEDKAKVSREGKWESGAGRCAVSGRRILGGTEGLRRIVV